MLCFLPCLLHAFPYRQHVSPLREGVLHSALALHEPELHVVQADRLVALVLRPLRLISRHAGMRLVLVSLVEALPAVSNVFGVMLALQFVFAIVGMQLFGSAFASCSDPAILDPRHCVGSADAAPPLPIAAPAAPPLIAMFHERVARERAAAALQVMRRRARAASHNLRLCSLRARLTCCCAVHCIELVL